MIKFVVVGGGTAGWLTALFLKKNIAYSKVTVIASDEIGILGAGEGTNWDFIKFLQEIDIPVDQVIKHAKGTFKNGIKFSNWNGDGTHYYHPFYDHLGKETDPEKNRFDPIPFYLHKLVDNKNFNDLQFTSIISEDNRVKYVNDTQEELGLSALHFDANLLAQYLQSVGIERGIDLIDDEVVEIITNKKGDISELQLKSGSACETTFVFDCTGFKRLIIGDFYKSEWIDYQNSLPVNRAIPFFIEHDNQEIPPYTEAIAMKYGWMWKIPVQGRFGCGYVFDSRVVSDDAIKQEIKEYLGFEPDFPRVFDFKPGVYKDVWINNCIAIGLSSGFVEPLEATSIQVSTFALRSFAFRINDMIRNRKNTSAEFNKEMKQVNDHILSFLHFHYLSKRNDTEFWKLFSENNVTPPFVKKFGEISKKSLPQDHDYDYLTIATCPIGIPPKNPFTVYNWHMVGAGINYFSSSITSRQLEKYKNFDMEQQEARLISILNTAAATTYKHSDYIEYLKQL
jgi:tryptophan halogenase